MSRTNHSAKGPGFEYWASRWHGFDEFPGRYTKTKTHRHERRMGKEEVQERTPAMTMFAAPPETRYFFWDQWDDWMIE